MDHPRTEVPPLCPNGRLLIEAEKISAFIRHLSNCWTCTLSVSAIGDGDRCPIGTAYLVAYLLDPLPQHWRRVERHSRECWHCMQVFPILAGACHVETS